MDAEASSGAAGSEASGSAPPPVPPMPAADTQAASTDAAGAQPASIAASTAAAPPGASTTTPAVTPAASTTTTTEPAAPAPDAAAPSAPTGTVVGIGLLGPTSAAPAPAPATAAPAASAAPSAAPSSNPAAAAAADQTSSSSAQAAAPDASGSGSSAGGGSSSRSRHRSRSPVRGSRRGRSPSPDDGPPLDCRIFIGNLASERVSREELTSMFARHGRVLEISMHKSFGFIQFDNPTSARAAIAAENRRVLAGLTLDIKMAKNKAHVSSRDRERDRDRDRDRERDRDRDRRRSPPPPARAGDRERCLDFLNGSCHRSNCRFAHDVPADGDSGSRGVSREMCKNFQVGRCNRGAMCKYSHDERDSNRDSNRDSRYREWERGGSSRDLYGDRDRMDDQRQRRAPVCEFLVVTPQREAHDFAATAAKTFSAEGIMSGVRALGPQQRIGEMLETMARNEVKYCCIVDALRGPRGTMTIKFLYRGPGGPDFRDVFLTQGIEIIHRDMDQGAPQQPPPHHGAPPHAPPGAYGMPPMGGPPPPQQQHGYPPQQHHMPPPQAGYGPPQPDPYQGAGWGAGAPPPQQQQQPPAQAYGDPTQHGYYNGAAPAQAGPPAPQQPPPQMGYAPPGGMPPQQNAYAPPPGSMYPGGPPASQPQQGMPAAQAPQQYMPGAAAAAAAAYAQQPTAGAPAPVQTSQAQHLTSKIWNMLSEAKTASTDPRMLQQQQSVAPGAGVPAANLMQSMVSDARRSAVPGASRAASAFDPRDPATSRTAYGAGAPGSKAHPGPIGSGRPKTITATAMGMPDPASQQQQQQQYAHAGQERYPYAGQQAAAAAAGGAYGQPQYAAAAPSQGAAGAQQPLTSTFGSNPRLQQTLNAVMNSPDILSGLANLRR